MSVTGEKHLLSEGKPSWRIGSGLKETKMVFRTLIDESLRVYGKDGMLFRRGSDYLVDSEWGNLTRNPSGRIAEKEIVFVDYKYHLSRIDLIQRNSTGKISVKRGAPSLTCPLPPSADSGSSPIITVYLAPDTTILSRRNVYFIINGGRTKPVACLKPEAAVRRLAAGKPLKLVCFGDSITHYGDASCHEKSYCGLLKSYLERRFPKSKLKMINAGIGGNSTDDAMKRIREDVLARKPDLVTIMFGVNDENGPRGSWKTTVPLPRYEKNIRVMVQLIRRIGAEVILMSPTLKNPGWEHTSGHINDYRKAMSRIASQEQVPFADVTGAWLDLEKQGIPFMPYLSTCINHPNDYGHRLIFNTLKTVFD